MRRLHVAAGVVARPARGFADEVDDMAPDAHFAVVGKADEEPLFLVVRRKPPDELIRHRGNGVVAAEPLVERFFLGACRSAAQRQRNERNGEWFGKDWP